MILRELVKFFESGSQRAAVVTITIPYKDNVDYLADADLFSAIKIGNLRVLPDDVFNKLKIEIHIENV